MRVTDITKRPIAITVSSSISGNYLNLTIPMNISLIPLAPISHCADNTQKISEYPPLFLMLIPL